MEARGIYFSSLVILLSLVGDVMGARTCTKADITRCLLASQPRSRTPSAVRLFCRSGLPKFRGCIHEVIDACQRSTNLGTATVLGSAKGALAGLEYACSDANVDEYAQLSQCVDGRRSLIIVGKCNQGMMGDILESFCRAISSFKTCVKEGVGGLCGKQAGQFMDSMMLHVLQITLGHEYSHVFSQCNLNGVKPIAKEIPKDKDPGQTPPDSQSPDKDFTPRQTPPDSQSPDKDFTPLKAGIGAAAAVVLLACVILGVRMWKKSKKPLNDDAEILIA